MSGVFLCQLNKGSAAKTAVKFFRQMAFGFEKRRSLFCLRKMAAAGWLVPLVCFWQLYIGLNFNMKRKRRLSFSGRICYDKRMVLYLKSVASQIVGSSDLR